MTMVMFVHGTGVREKAFNASFSLVKNALGDRLSATNVRIEPCYWGGSCGSKLFLNGLSVPDFDSTRSVEAESFREDEYELALWSMLYEEPGAELQLLALRSSAREIPPGRQPPGEALSRAFRLLGPDFAKLPPDKAAELRDRLAHARLLGALETARDVITAKPSFAEALQRAEPPMTEYRLALARALIAASARITWNRSELPEGVVLLDGAGIDVVIELLVAALGGREAGALGWVKERAGRLIAGAGTRWFGRRRGRLSEQMAPFGADVIAYQVRPAPIRKFIRKALDDAVVAANARGERARVFILAHSLGGIAAVETLIEAPHEAVAGLITVGSQVPLLYELDALGTFPLPRDENGRPTGQRGILPCHFGYRWLNIYDRRDFLGYRAAGVFGEERVRDAEVNNRQPFPESHSAYWANPQVWEVVAAFIREEA